jgi:3-dehydrosphinganine reductase
VNAAGIIVPGYFERMPIEDFETCIRCGYFTVVYPTRAVVPAMIARGAGRIVNVGSMGGIIGVFGYTAYASAKFAVMGFSEALRYEMKPLGISVHVVCPSDTDTPGLAYEQTLRPYETDVVNGEVKPVSPEAVAEALVRGVEKGRYLIVPDLMSKVYGRIRRLSDTLSFAIMDSLVAKARRQLADGTADLRPEQASARDRIVVPRPAEEGE